MAIYYGFFSCAEKRSDEVLAKAKAAYEALDENHKNFMNSTLPPLLMAVGVGTVIEATIPVIARRWMILSPTDGCDLARQIGAPRDPWSAIEAYLRPFIGVVTNVGYDTDAEFNKRVRWHGLPFGKAQIKSLQRATRG